MRQKRQQFQKQIRRQTIDLIFKKYRKKYFNFSPQIKLSQQTVEEIKDQCYAEFMRYSNDISEALKDQNQNVICTAVKESSELLKHLLNKAAQSPDCLKFIVSTWFNFGFCQLMFQSVNIFTNYPKSAFNSTRKETFKWAVDQIYQIFQYQATLEKRTDDNGQMFSFLFLAIVELENEPKSFRQIILLLNSVLFPSVKARHEFFFQNRVMDLNNNCQKICFQHLISAMFQNKDRLRLVEGNHQLSKFIEIKLFFIELFKLYCYELQDIEKYVQRKQQKSSQKFIYSSQTVKDSLYEQTLSRTNHPEKICLKSFLDKAHITIIYEVIKEIKSFSFEHWPEDVYHQENLAISLEAFKLFLEFCPSKSILKEFENELEFLLGILISKEMNVAVKNETVTLIDMIVYLGDSNTIDFLIRHQCLFQRVWSYEEPNILNVKLNFLNNLLLTDAGFDVAMKYINEISIVLMGTKHVYLALTFCYNYFLRTEYKIEQSLRFDVVIGILYSLPEEKFEIRDAELDFCILAHLYNNEFRRDIPERYHKWKLYNIDLRSKCDYVQGKDCPKNQQMARKQQLADRLIELSSQILYPQRHPMDD